MRKKTLNDLIDNIFWYAIYMLPILCMLLVIYQTGAFVSLSSALSSVGLGILIDNPILLTISGIFGAGGVLPLFQSTDILVYICYFVSVFILHLLVDFVLFIPRLCHKWMKSLYGGND
jgi:hypothetical protein